VVGVIPTASFLFLPSHTHHEQMLYIFCIKASNQRHQQDCYDILYVASIAK